MPQLNGLKSKANILQKQIESYLERRYSMPHDEYRFESDKNEKRMNQLTDIYKKMNVITSKKMNIRR